VVEKYSNQNPINYICDKLLYRIIIQFPRTATKSGDTKNLENSNWGIGFLFRTSRSVTSGVVIPIFRFLTIRQFRGVFDDGLN